VHTVNKKNVSLRISENNASAAGIFYGELGLTVLTSDTTLKKNVSQRYVSSQSHGRYVPMALERWSPWSVFTSLISNESR